MVRLMLLLMAALLAVMAYAFGGFTLRVVAGDPSQLWTLLIALSPFLVLGVYVMARKNRDRKRPIVLMGTIAGVALLVTLILTDPLGLYTPTPQLYGLLAAFVTLLLIEGANRLTRGVP